MPVNFAPRRVERLLRADGTFILRSPTPLRPYARCVGDWLERWARAAPERTFLCERGPAAPGSWRGVGYGDALATVRALAQGLLDLGATADRPLLLLSDNSVDHGLLQLAAMHIGVPAAPVSPAYSLLSSDHAKLREVARRVRPGIVYADDPTVYARGLAALAGLGVPIITSRGGAGVATVGELAGRTPGAAVDRAHAAVTGASIAKILFTSGSTGAPKGVVNSQRMLCSNQEAIAQVWPFLEERPPVTLDWLPWSHTFGGNHNFNMMLRHGGTLYIDGGKPVAERIAATVDNLRAVAPTVYFNVPRGFSVLLPYLEGDDRLRDHFFSRTDVLFYAAAALPQPVWARLEELSLRARGERVPFVSAWGSTETAPLVTSVHFAMRSAGVIGLPAPGCELKLVPHDDKLEMRVRGPNVTPGSWDRGQVTSTPLDDEGFLATGDAGRLADESDPTAGVVFDGRLAENFKLSTGAWVCVGELRIAIIGACAPAIQDAVIAGHDRDEVTAILFAAPAPDPALRANVRAALAAHNAANSGHSTRVVRALIATEPPSIDAGEITDKGYLNQRAILVRRASAVAALYATPPPPEVIEVES